LRIGARRINTSVVLVILGAILSIAPSVAQQTSFRNAPASAAVMKNPYTGSATAATAGKKLYSQDCAQCHGNNLQGMGPAPALDTSAVRYAKAGELFWFISTGKLTSGMPSWSNLPKQQRWQIVTFLESRSNEKTAAK
jgi:mono/diheme cytochrome c family protein